MQRAGLSRRGRPPHPVTWRTLAGIAAVFFLMGLPQVLVPPRTPAPMSDAPVLALQPTRTGFGAPLDDGRLELRFVRIGTSAHAQIDLFGASGDRRVLPRGGDVHLEWLGSEGRRTQIDFQLGPDRLLSVQPVSSLPDRSTLVVHDGHGRHVYALDRR